MGEDFGDTMYSDYPIEPEDDYPVRHRNRKKSSQHRKESDKSKNGSNSDACVEPGVSGYGRTFGYLYDRAWSLIKAAFKKEHKLDQMELFNEACAARLQAHYGATKYRRRRELEILCRRTKFTRNELKLLYWGWKCACPNGTLTESTFKEIYAQFFPQAGDSSLYAHYVYRAMFGNKGQRNGGSGGNNNDDNINANNAAAGGEVHFGDYAQALSTLSRGGTNEKLEWIFRLYDINGDNVLTVDEIIEISKAIYALLGFYVSPAHDQRTCDEHGYKVFQRLDPMGKGFVTFNEFIEICSKDEKIIRSMQLLDTIGLD
ncbi:A-type potassium channel modulatory protein KCNIP1-like [Brevipalpus obovatus]|uniref:A-type potassium channel modulatory protein KCNIP1-like n=1 Tax=Brevipalpus obovatus TaxID=246614 RepID=UPI003D9F2819